MPSTRELVIPPGTQPGEIIRLKGEGVPYPRGGRRGDLLVEVKVDIPRELTPRQEELLRELSREEGSAEHGDKLFPRQHTGQKEGFFQKVWNTVKEWHNT